MDVTQAETITNIASDTHVTNIASETHELNSEGKVTFTIDGKGSDTYKDAIDTS